MKDLDQLNTLLVEDYIMNLFYAELAIKYGVKATAKQIEEEYKQFLEEFKNAFSKIGE